MFQFIWDLDYYEDNLSLGDWDLGYDLLGILAGIMLKAQVVV